MTKYTKSTIIDLLKLHKKELQTYGLMRVGLFGSYVAHSQTEQSDIDLLLEFKPGKKNYRSFMQSADKLEEILQKNVDVLTPEALSPFIGPHILKEVEYVEIAE